MLLLIGVLAFNQAGAKIIIHDNKGASWPYDQMGIYFDPGCNDQFDQSKKMTRIGNSDYYVYDIGDANVVVFRQLNDNKVGNQTEDLNNPVNLGVYKSGGWVNESTKRTITKVGDAKFVVRGQIFGDINWSDKELQTSGSKLVLNNVDLVSGDFGIKVLVNNDQVSWLFGTDANISEGTTKSVVGTDGINIHSDITGKCNIEFDPVAMTIKITKVAQTVATPSISQSGNMVTITCGTDGADIYYTTDGSTPTTSSTKYTASFDITSNCTVKAIAVKSGWTNSEVASKAVTYTAPASSDVTFYVKNDGNWDALRVWAWEGSTPIFSVTGNDYSNRPYLIDFNSSVVKDGYKFIVEKGHVGEDVVWKITTTSNIGVKVSNKGDGSNKQQDNISNWNGKVLATSNTNSVSTLSGTWEAGEPVVDAYKDYKVQLKWAGNTNNNGWADYSDQGSISNGVWTISNLDLKDNGGFNLRVYDGSNYTEYGIGSNTSNSKINNNQEAQLHTGNNYVYTTADAVVNLSLDLASMRLTATWTEKVIEKNKLYITGNVNVGSGKVNGWGQQLATLTEISDGVYSGVVDKLIGEWIIYDGVNHENWNFARGGEIDKLAIGKKSQVWFRSGVNFNTNFDKKVRVTFTLVKGSAQEHSSIPSTVLIEDVSDKDYVYFVNKNTGWNNPHIYTYTNAYEDSNGTKHDMSCNASFPGVELSEKADDVREALGETCDVYRYEVDIDKYEQVVFAQSRGNQTRNYHLVSGGIYYPDADLLPDNYWYTDQQITDYVLNEGEYLDVYPNDNVSTEYNNVYVNDALLFSYLLEGELVGEGADAVFTPALDEETGELQVRAGHNICIDIKDGSKTYTGNANTTTVVPVFIGGKVFLRLALADDILANNSEGLDVKFYVKSGETEEYENTGFDLKVQPYHDGIVYYRNGTTADINKLVAPERVYVVANGNGITFKNGNKLAAGEERNLAKGTNSASKVVYTLSNVAPESAFTVFAEFDNNGEVAMKQYGFGKTEGNLTLRPGVNNDCDYEKVGVYTIFRPQNNNGTNFYNVTIEWDEQEIYISPVAKGSNLEVNEEQGYYTFNAKADAYIQVRHDTYFGADVAHYNDYSSLAFINHEDAKGNKLNAHVNFKKDFSTTNFKAVDDEVSQLTVNAPMGGVFAVKVSHEPIVATGYSLARTSVNVPVRVIPTVESVGLYIQGQPVAAIKNGSSTGYAVYIPELEMDDEWHYKGYDGYDQSIVTWDPEKRLKIQCVDEYAAQTANNGNKSAATIYIKKGESAQAKHYAPSVLKVAANTALDVTSDEYAEEREGFTPFSITNTLTRNDENPSFYIEQNGVASEPATLTIAKTPEQFNTLTGQNTIPVGVENIELDGADEDVEAVYYNLNGVRVNAETLAPGLYIVVKGNHSEKIIVK